MSEIRVDTISEKTSGSGTTISNLKNPNQPFRNLIINGDYAIAQRASSATTAGNGTYTTLDRWQTYNATDGAYTTARTALSAADQATTGQYYAYDIQCSTADSSIGASQYAFVLQKIEAQFLQSLRFGTSNAQPVTISFYVKSNLTGTTCGFISKEDSTFTMCPFEFTINSADTWERKTATIPANDVIKLAASAITYDNGPGISVGFNLAMGSNLDNGTNLTWEATTAGYATSNQLNFLSNTANDLFITGVQFEVGSGASDFEYLPHDVQLHRCQRYYHKIDVPDNASYYPFGVGECSSTQTSTHITHYPVTMRTAPTLETSGTASHFTTFNEGALHQSDLVPGLGGATKHAMRVQFKRNSSAGLTTGTATQNLANVNASAFIAFTSEL
tara:strand:+ start:625 stop:1791 length:1167 start_codon:yes stop_codon:yes gene_type:complete